MRNMRTMQSDAKLIDVALGRAPGDLAIVNARLVNVYTGEILDGQSVCTSGAGSPAWARMSATPSDRRPR